MKKFSCTSLDSLKFCYCLSPQSYNYYCRWYDHIVVVNVAIIFCFNYEIALLSNHEFYPFPPTLCPVRTRWNGVSEQLPGTCCLGLKHNIRKSIRGMTEL